MNTVHNKGNEYIISNDSPFMKWHIQFTAVPFKALSGQECPISTIFYLKIDPV